MFKMYAWAHAQHIALEKYLRSQYLINIRDEQYRRILDIIEYNRRQRHDLRHHLLTLQGLWENGETEKARDYLSRYLVETDSIHVENFCSNPIISAFFLNDAVKTIINRDHEHLSAAEHVQMNEAVCFGSAFRCLQRIFQKIFGQNGKIGILYGERIRNMNMGGQFYAAFTGKREIMAYQHIDDRIRTEIFDMDTVCFHQIRCS